MGGDQVAFKCYARWQVNDSFRANGTTTTTTTTTTRTTTTNAGKEQIVRSSPYLS